MILKWNNAFSTALAASVAAFVATTNLYAIPRGPCEPKPVIDCGCPEPAPGPFAFAFPLDRDLNCPDDFYVYADFLAMQAKQDGMEFAIVNSNPDKASDLTNGTVGGFSTNNNDWSYSFGARFGAGIYVDHDAWNVDAVWSWLNIRDYQTFNASSGNLLPLWEAPSDLDSVYGPRSSAVWNCNYNILDIRLGKPYYVSRYVVFNPHVGFRGGWISQHFSVDYSGAPGGGHRAVHHGENDFWGVGIRTGIDTDWMITRGFSIFGNVAGSILYGKFRVDQMLQVPDADEASFVVADRHYMNVPNAEIAMGVAWGQRIFQDRYYISLKAGYEFHVWFDQLNMRRFFQDSTSFANDVVSRGNLTLNGVSFRASLDL